MLRTVEMSLERGTTPIMMKLPNSIVAQLKATATKHNISTAEVIRRIIENHIQQPVRVRPYRPRKEDT